MKRLMADLFYCLLGVVGLIIIGYAFAAHYVQQWFARLRRKSA